MTFHETQEQFARRLGLSSITVARYETNSRPRTAILVRLAAAAREQHLEEYARIFEGDETGTTELERNEFHAAIDFLQSVIDALMPYKLRAIRAAAALLESDTVDLDKVEELLGRDLLRADEVIQRFASHYDFENAEDRRAKDGAAKAGIETPRSHTRRKQKTSK